MAEPDSVFTGCGVPGCSGGVALPRHDGCSLGQDLSILLSAGLVVEKPSGMINYHTMATMKVTVTLEIDSLRGVDRLVREGRFPSRSRAVQAALAEMLARRKRSRLAEELAKLDPREERALAEEALAGEPAWPEY